MKILLVVCIMILSYLIGNSYKYKLQNEFEFINYLKNFTDFLKSNINLFKNNIVQIIDEFKVLNRNMNIKFNEIFVKNNEFYEVSEEKISQFITDKQTAFVIFSFLSKLGSNDYEFEANKINSFSSFLESKLLEYSNNLKTKAELFLKVALGIGAVVSILIW